MFCIESHHLKKDRSTAKFDWRIPWMYWGNGLTDKEGAKVQSSIWSEERLLKENDNIKLFLYLLEGGEMGLHRFLPIWS